MELQLIMMLNQVFLVAKMSKEIKTDDVIFNFFKQVCDEKDDVKCVELGNGWISAMETNLANMEKKSRRN